MVKPLQKLKIYDTFLSIAANWRNADPLDYAWFAYSEPELQQRYRDSGKKPDAAILALQFEMRMELRERIGDGEFVALGIPVDIASDRKPAIVPATFFAANSVKILWDDNAVSGLGQSFNEVRICCAMTTTDQKELPAIEKHIAAKRGGGRSNLYFMAKPVLAELLSDPAFAAMTANPLLGPFNRVFVERYSTPERKVAGISERSLRTYLELYRQELAETGNNKSAN